MDLFLSILKGLGLLFLVIMVFNLMIVVHELGHYWAAKWRGLKVEKFQIWFGKAILKWRDKDGVEWGLGSIPAGGFVKLPQMAPMEAIEGSSEFDEPLAPITPLDKIIVAIAGPLFSIGLAFLFACLVSVVGTPKSVVESTSIGYVLPDSSAEEAGLLPGDRIITINGTKVLSFSGMIDSVMERIVLSKGDEIEFVVERPGEANPVTVISGFRVPETSVLSRPGTRQVGIGWFIKPIVAETLENSPGALAGLLPGDEVIAVNGQPVYHTATVEEAAVEGDAKLSVLRGDEEIEIFLSAVTPMQPAEADPQIGVAWDYSAMVSSKLDRPGPIEQISTGLTLMWRTISTVASPKSDVSVRHMSGPIGIGTHYYDMLSMPDGWRRVLWFSVILNVNLAVLNMLPLPVLDGGHIMISLLEWIRRKPINLRVLEYVQIACTLGLFGFMLLVTFGDGGDLVKRGADAAKEEPLPLKFAPPEGEPAAAE